MVTSQQVQPLTAQLPHQSLVSQVVASSDTRGLSPEASPKDQPLETPKKKPATKEKDSAKNSNQQIKHRMAEESEHHPFKELAVKYLLGGQHNDLIKNEDV